MNRTPRAFGLLHHPTSLPCRHGIGSIGQPAHAFIDLLTETGVSLWQILPLTPPATGNSPYSSDTAFAGNPLLICLDDLVSRGLLAAEAVSSPNGSPHSVDFAGVSAFKMPLFKQAFDRFERDGGARDPSFLRFMSDHAFWLDDYALFKAIQATAGSFWLEWPLKLKFRDAGALGEVRDRDDHLIRFHTFLQYLFDQQWNSVKRHATQSGVTLIGDIPIFVSLGSVDVWKNPALFQLDADLKPVSVAGVPPDYFSKTGQLWGNPLYDWAAMAADKYRWWTNRFAVTLRAVDCIRVDHFRGFEAYWAVPAVDRTAENGEWKPGPGSSLFDTIRDVLGEIPVIAEDLGCLTPEVERLRDRLGFPGMKVLQFAFGGDAFNPYLAHNHTPHSVVYTATHDNDTTRGWWQTLVDAERERIGNQMTILQGHPVTDPVSDLIRLALGSVANWAIVPVQDVLNLGSEARMNRPGVAEGNWGWRMVEWNRLRQCLNELRPLLELTGRFNSPR
ncbi:4-alpha-glucanotransferase [bacterium]|nr:4-alpha-glucanotransferase [candidate division CSSED10-310 bacterium]